MKTKYFITLISLFLMFSSCREESSVQTFPLNDFKQIPVPIINSPEHDSVRARSGSWFSVAIADGKLQIGRDVYEPKLEYSLPEGKLISIDQGEFGGGLYYKPNDTTKRNFFVTIDGKHKTVIANPWDGGLMDEESVLKNYGHPFLIKNGNVRYIFPYQDSISVIEGLAHKSLRTGMIYSLKFKNNNFILANPYYFRDFPIVITIFNNKIYVLTEKSLFVVDKSSRKQVFSNMFWYGLDPNSIAVKDERNIYVGMRGGYAKINFPLKKVAFINA
ncbi:MAG: hypothetical protein EOO43_06900 [Flavobacterium sp.]|nr:MAG: hypothetical protein EOO43_06900 [Flavobacterium sp.]